MEPINRKSIILLFLFWSSGVQASIEILDQDFLDDFKQQSILREDAELSFQVIPLDSAECRMDDLTFSLLDEDLVPVTSFTDNAFVEIDGIRQEAPVPMVFTSVRDEDLLITKDIEGRLVSAHHTRLGLELVHVRDSTYATVHSSHYDDSIFSQFRTETKSRPKSQLRSGDKDESHSDDGHHRSLQIGRCSSYGGYDVIDIGIVVDSRLCSYFGGSSKATATVQSILATASSYYEKNGLCKKLQMKFLKMYCNQSTDPIDSIYQAMSRSGGVSPSSLLDKFTTFAGQENLDAAAIHLLHGIKFPNTGTIGFAWVDGVCLKGWNTGVDYLAWGTSVAPLGGILAHETGHLMDCSHVNDPNDLMYSTILQGTNQKFGSADKAIINSTARNRSCIRFVSS